MRTSPYVNDVSENSPQYFKLAYRANICNKASTLNATLILPQEVGENITIFAKCQPTMKTFAPYYIDPIVSEAYIYRN